MKKLPKWANEWVFNYDSNQVEPAFYSQAFGEFYGENGLPINNCKNINAGLEAKIGVITLLFAAFLLICAPFFNR